MARSLKTRISRLEAASRTGDYTAAVQDAWEMEATQSRVAARVRLYIGNMLDAPLHPSVVSARTLLLNDTPEQHAADLEVLQRWKVRHPDAFPPDEEGGNRVMRKLEEMAQRQEAYRELTAQNHQT